MIVICRCTRWMTVTKRSSRTSDLIDAHRRQSRAVRRAAVNMDSSSIGVSGMVRTPKQEGTPRCLPRESANSQAFMLATSIRRIFNAIFVEGVF